MQCWIGFCACIFQYFCVKLSPGRSRIVYGTCLCSTDLTILMDPENACRLLHVLPTSSSEPSKQTPDITSVNCSLSSDLTLFPSEPSEFSDFPDSLPPPNTSGVSSAKLPHVLESDVVTRGFDDVTWCPGDVTWWPGDNVPCLVT